MTETRAERQERVAKIEKQTEEGMHSTAALLPEPNRSQIHERANRLSERAARRMEEAGDGPDGDPQ